MWIDKSVDGMLGIRTRASRMEGTDESTELPRPAPKNLTFAVALLYQRTRTSVKNLKNVGHGCEPKVVNYDRRAFI